MPYHSMMALWALGSLLINIIIIIVIGCLVYPVQHDPEHRVRGSNQNNWQETHEATHRLFQVFEELYNASATVVAVRPTTASLDIFLLMHAWPYGTCQTRL